MEIELPDGTILEAPDDADPELVAKAYMRSRAPEYPIEGPSVMARVGRGMMDPIQGVKQLVLQGADAAEGSPYGARAAAASIRAGEQMGDGDNAEAYTQRVNDELELYNKGREAQGGGIDWARIGGNAAIAAPAGGAAALPARLGPRMAVGAMEGAALGGSQFSPDGDHTGGAMVGGAVGGAVPVAGSVLRAALGGMKPATDAAAQFLKDKVPLTVGQMAGGAMQSIEQALSKLPIVGPAVRARQQEALGAWNKNLMNEVSPEGEVSTHGQQGMRDLTSKFHDAYEALWNRDIPLKGAGVAPGKAIEQIDDELRRDAQTAARKGERELADELRARRQRLRDLLPDEVSAELSRLDGLYVQFATLRRAGSYVGPAGNGGTFGAGNLQSASSALDRSAGKGATARGTAPLQPQAQQASQVFGNSAAPPASVLERIALSPIGIAARPLYSKPVQNWMTGQNPMQRLVAEQLGNDPTSMQLVNAMRRYGRTALPSFYTAPTGETE